MTTTRTPITPPPARSDVATGLAFLGLLVLFLAWGLPLAIVLWRAAL